MKPSTFGIKALCGTAAFTILAQLSLTAAVQLDEGLALYLPLTADLKDHSPAGHPVEVVGNVRIDRDGAFFGGRKDWLEAPHIDMNDRPFAVTVWIRETTEEETVGLVEQFDLARPLRHLSLMLRNNRHPYFGFYVMDVASPFVVPRTQEWVHLAFQFTGKEEQIWVNGRLICSREAPSYQGTTGVTAIGKMTRWGNVPGKDFVGYMRDFRIYQRTLDYEEIGLLAGINQPKAAEKPTVAQASIPELSKTALESREAMTQVLSTDPALPFLQISGQQIIVNGRIGQVYTLESSGDLNSWNSLARMTNQTGRVIYEAQDQPFTRSQFFRVKVEGFKP